MDDKERIEWLKSLKAGDVVYNICRSYSYLVAVKEYTIKKITPAGKIRLNDDTLLDNSGSTFGDHWGSGSMSILPMCDEVKKAIHVIKTENLLNKCKESLSKVDKSKLDYETLFKIKELIDTMC